MNQQIFTNLVSGAICLEIPYIQVTTYVRTSQSANYLLSQDFRPFRHVQVVIKGKYSHYGTQSPYGSTAMMANIAIWAITAISAIKTIPNITAMRVIRVNIANRATGEIVAITAIKVLKTIISITTNVAITAIMAIVTIVSQSL